MIQLLTPGAKALRPADSHADLPADVLWIDLLEPDTASERRIEQFVDVDIPTREEMREIEESSRLRREGDTLYLTVRVLIGIETLTPSTTAITFVLSRRCLVTVRYADPSAFRRFGERFTKPGQAPLANGAEVFVELLERIVDRVADALENVESELEEVSQRIFREPGAVVVATAGAGGAGGKITATAPTALEPVVDLQAVLKRLGRRNALIAKLRESLLSIARLLPFLCGSAAANWMGDELKERLNTLQRDVQSLSEYDGHLAGEIAFLLDSTLGLINIEQNDIIKVFTIASVLFLPPTLVGTVYGMNFKAMPELDWFFGYPFALVLMVLSALAPYWYFKRKRWF